MQFRQMVMIIAIVLVASGLALTAVADDARSGSQQGSTQQTQARTQAAAGGQPTETGSRGAADLAQQGTPQRRNLGPGDGTGKQGERPADGTGFGNPGRLGSGAAGSGKSAAKVSARDGKGGDQGTGQSSARARTRSQSLRGSTACDGTARRSGTVRGSRRGGGRR